jgi:biuret amidohydrolase
MRRALLVLDFQNDFCSPAGKGARLRGDLSRLERTAANIQIALDRARRAGIPVGWVRFIGDRKYQSANLLARDRRQRKPAKCLEGSWGADFFRVAPRPGERVFDKKGGRFDAFFSPSLERWLRRRGVAQLALAGVYLDVCVDSTARTAFQKGYEVRVLTDCTESLFYPKRLALEFMRKYYGAALVSSATL